ncbi:MAG: HD family hydrolase [Candidatus Thorarchaeota archaeon]
MHSKEIMNLLLKLNNLKNLSRSGWSLAGIQNQTAESVADHSWGTAVIALLLALLENGTGSNLNISRILTMAIIHDSPESILSDIPSSTVLREHEQFQQVKLDLENRGFEILFSDLSEEKIQQKLAISWQEYTSGKTKEAKIVKSADILDMLIQARSFENSGTPPYLLDSFFTTSQDILRVLGSDFAMDIFDELLKDHETMMNKTTS